MAIKKELDSLNMKEIARRLYVLRVSRGLSREELARKSGVAPSTLPKLEGAKVYPSVEQVFALSRALDVKPGYFFDLTSAPKIVAVYPTLKESAEMLLDWVDSHPSPSELPLDLLRALRSKTTQEKVRSFLKLDLELPELHREVLRRLEAAQAATIPPVRDETHSVGPLG